MASKWRELKYKFKFLESQLGTERPEGEREAFLWDICNQTVEAAAAMRDAHEEELQALRHELANTKNHLKQSQEKCARLSGKETLKQPRRVKAPLPAQVSTRGPTVRRDGIQRCEVEDKVKFTSKRKARESMRSKSAALRPYPCIHCGGWHLTGRKR